MNADIDEHGKLTITPNTAIESYALSQWWKEYMKSQGGTPAPCEATLEVCIITGKPDD